MTADDIIASILQAREIEDSSSFFSPSYDRHSHSPWLMPDMKFAVARLIKAKNTGEKVAIYGDYDIDGLTATTILMEAFAAFGIDAIAYIPDRYTDGYGLSINGIDSLKKQGVALIVTVDCGSTSVKEVAHANQIGVDVIVTDHHHVGDVLPRPLALVNPKRVDSEYPFKDLAGVGVAFKLVQALQEKLDGLPKGQEKWLLDLVALGTVCDVVELKDENRMLVWWGLKVMRQTRRPGLRALAQAAATQIEAVTSSDLGWRFGPRLNAAGRLESAQSSLDLLMTPRAKVALELAEQLNRYNDERKATQSEIYSHALRLAQNYQDDPVLVLSHPDWSHGVIGIVAGKLTRELGRPVFLLQETDGVAKGSARSFGDFELAPAIAKSKKHIVKGGGHAFAAGVTLEADKVDDFRQAINDIYRKSALTNQDKFLTEQPDVTLEDFSGLDNELLVKLELLEPFGQGNNQPILQVNNVEIASWRPVGAGRNHAKLWLRDAKGRTLDGIGFNLSDQAASVNRQISVSFYFEPNEFRGRVTPQARIISFS